MCIKYFFYGLPFLYFLFHFHFAAATQISQWPFGFTLMTDIFEVQLYLEIRIKLAIGSNGVWIYTLLIKCVYIILLFNKASIHSKSTNELFVLWIYQFEEHISTQFNISFDFDDHNIIIIFVSLITWLDVIATGFQKLVSRLEVGIISVNHFVILSVHYLYAGLQCITSIPWYGQDDNFLDSLNTGTLNLSLENLLKILNVSLLARLCNTTACIESFPPIIRHCICKAFGNTWINEETWNTWTSAAFASITIDDNNIVFVLHQKLKEYIAWLEEYS